MGPGGMGEGGMMGPGGMGEGGMMGPGGMGEGGMMGMPEVYFSADVKVFSSYRRHIMSI